MPEKREPGFCVTMLGAGAQPVWWLRGEGIVQQRRYGPWPQEVVRGVAEVLADTTTGLSGSELGQLLADIGVQDPYATSTKRDRLFQALWLRQSQDQAANCVIAFITKAMAPVRYRGAVERFTARQGGLGEVLVYVGMRVNDEGRVARGATASTLSEAAKHASSLRTELSRRNTHPKVLDSCTTEVLAKNAFHASLEATKGLAQRLRDLTGEDGDGAAIVDAAISLGRGGTPRLAINSLRTSSERDEQTGFANLLKGIFGMYRNPVAHDPRGLRAVTDDELLELLTMVSMAHRRLDNAQPDPHGMPARSVRPRPSGHLPT